MEKILEELEGVSVVVKINDTVKSITIKNNSSKYKKAAEKALKVFIEEVNDTNNIK